MHRTSSNIATIHSKLPSGVGTEVTATKSSVATSMGDSNRCVASLNHSTTVKMQDPSLGLSPGTVVVPGSPSRDPNAQANPQPRAVVILVGEAHVIGPHWAHAPILGSVFFGTQVIWSTEMAYGMSGILQMSAVLLMTGRKRLLTSTHWA